MSLGYSDNGRFHTSINSEVIKQLSLRSDIVGTRTSRTPEDITYLNSNTSWIKVTSAADIEDLDTGDKQPAGEYILYGGTYSETFGKRRGFLQNQQGVFEDNSSYTFSEVNGIVPMPGITSFVIQSKDFYGSIRGASINFTVHSKEDFDKLESLYLRPGFSILVEWGHSIVLDNETGTISTTVEEYPTKDFLVKQDYFDIIDKINNLRGINGNSYNYDAFYGWINNFAWNFNGYSYECQVDMMSAGSLLLALQSSYPTFNKTTENESGDKNKYKPGNYSSDLNNLLSAIADAKKPAGYFDSEATSADRTKVIESIINNIEKEAPEFYDIFKESNFILGYFTGESHQSEHYSGGVKFITLRDLFKTVNKIGLFKDRNGKNIIPFNVETVINFTTFPEHSCLNPYQFILPKKSNNEYILNISKQVDNLDPNDILNIFVSVDYLKTLLKDTKKQESRYQTLHTFITKLINSLEANLGGINEIDLLFDEDNSQFYLVDRSVVPGSTDFQLEGNGKPKSYIDLVGLKSEVTNLNITSTIDSELVGLIAIAAQSGPSSETSKYIQNVQKWSNGIVDRHFPKKSEGSFEDKVSTVKDDGTTEPSKKVKEEYLDFISKANEAKNTFVISYTEDFFNGYIDIHQKFTLQKLSEYTTSEDTNFAGTLPFKLNFTVKGVSGLKIGNIFKINEFFLPERYQNRVAFVIVGLSSKVENNQWLTDIEAYMIPI